VIKRRVLAALVAVLLAAGGGVLLLRYVGQADERAMAGMQATRVLVVTRPIPAETPAEKIGPFVNLKALPAVAVAPGSVASLAEIGGRVAGTNLQPGEQVLASRFVDPATLRPANEVKVPAGLSQVSLQMEPQRILGGQLTAGSTVGLFISLPAQGEQPGQTHLALNQVLVTRVVGGTTPTASSGDDDEATPGSAQPDGGLMVTLAVGPADAEKVVFGAEHGTIWLSQEPVGASVEDTRVITPKNVYR